MTTLVTIKARVTNKTAIYIKDISRLCKILNLFKVDPFIDRSGKSADGSYTVKFYGRPGIF